MCDFKPGDEIVYVGNPPTVTNPCGRALDPDAVYTVEAVGFVSPYATVRLVGFHNTARRDGFYAAMAFRKIERRNDSLSIEAFLTIKPGQFEEPKRAPAKKRERV